MLSGLFSYFKKRKKQGQLELLEHTLLYERDVEVLLHSCVEFLELIDYKEVLHHYRPIYGRNLMYHCILPSVWELSLQLRELVDALTTGSKLSAGFGAGTAREVSWEDYHSYESQHIELSIWTEIEALARLYSTSLRDALLCRPSEVGYLVRFTRPILSDLIANVLALKSIRDIEHESRSQKRNPGSSGQS